MKKGGIIVCGLLGLLALPYLHGADDERSENYPAPAPSATAGSGSMLPPPAVLRWNNGESITGRPIEADGAGLTWKTPLFEDPLLLAWPALHRIDWPAPPGSAPSGTFSLVLRDGSHLYGELIGLTPETVTIQSELHGTVTLRRPEVLSARRIKGGKLIYAGPLGEAGWKPAPPIEAEGGNTNIPDVLGEVVTRRTGPGGTLVLPFWHRAFSLGLPLPDRMEVAIHLHSKERPAFQFVLESAAKERLRLETWGDQLVLAAADGFAEIRPLDPQEREVALHVCWDRRAHRCEVYDERGTLLKDWTVPVENSNAESGVLLENKGAALTLDTLRVREWDGLPPPPAANAGEPYVKLDDGQVVAGNPSRLERGNVIIPAPGEGPEANIPLDQIDSLIFVQALPPPDLHDTVLTFTDGTFLVGQVAGLKSGQALLKTSHSDALLPAKIRFLRQVLIRTPAPAGTPPEPALKTLDKIVLGETTLHGRLVTAMGDAWPRWLPVGGGRPALPLKTLSTEITRTDAFGQAPDKSTLFYTRMGDVLPGTLHGLDRTGVEFDSPIVETHQLAADELQAVQFNVPPRASIVGFNAPGWRVLKGTAAEMQKTPGTLSLEPDSIVGHPAAMQNGEVTFSYDSTQFTCLRLRMFCRGTDPAGAVNYILFRMGSQMYTGVEPKDGQFSAENPTMVQNGSVAVRLSIDDNVVRCYLDGGLVDTVPLPSKKRAGNGLIIEPTSEWGNAQTEVMLSKFSANPEGGQNFLQDVSADAKAQALTVPRFRKDDPPRHALLAGNGDLLRGEVEAITNTQFGFRIGLETLRVPIDRVTAVIALQKPSDESPPAEEPDPMQKLLDRKMDDQTWFADFQQLISAIEQKVPELEIRLPAKLSSTPMQYRFGDKSAGDALQDLCERFGFRYRIDKKAIVIEAGSRQAPLEMVQKVYWLKSDAVAAHGQVHEALVDKGISFPDGAGVTWWKGSRQLEMTNTAANQEKLLALLEREFGGVIGSPTYWLLLTNGGRLGLNVDKFAADAVTGTHPLYGHCRVPMSEVFEIRNTVPPLTAAGRAVDDWQLVYAPEPVLPEAGQEDSKLLGKDAPPFKLTMLDGSNFELAREKGHVVVLDFWATWCGPCINALPGLIEAMAQFPADRVRLVGLDQAEAPEQVKRFIQARGWKLDVALDAGQNVGRQYGVDGIPHTVIVGPDGKVAWVKTGYTADGDTLAAEAVKKLLAPTAPPAAAPQQVVALSSR